MSDDSPILCNDQLHERRPLRRDGLDWRAKQDGAGATPRKGGAQGGAGRVKRGSRRTLARRLGAPGLRELMKRWQRRPPVN
eukprot:1010951-Pyramimonas_sp.AAC.1